MNNSKIPTTKESVNCNSSKFLPDLFAESLVLSTHFSQKLNSSTPIKPCVALMMNTSISKGDFVSRNTALHVISCELKSCGVCEKSCMSWAKEWNKKNNPPMPYVEVETVIWKVYHGNKDTGWWQRRSNRYPRKEH